MSLPAMLGRRTVGAIGMVLTALTSSCSVLAQGARTDLALFVVDPSLDSRSGEVFQGLGRFHPGLGVDAGIGYDRRDFGATFSVGLAGVEVGAPRTRDGIGMGREQGIYRSVAILGHWRPRPLFGRWRPMLSAGYVWSSLDNVLLRGDSLPDFARGLHPDPSDTARRRVGINGHGARLGLHLNRSPAAADFSGRMVMSLDAVVDAVAFRQVTYERRRAPIPGVRASLIPRLAVSLRWFPRASLDRDTIR